MTDMPHRDASTGRLIQRHLPASPEPAMTDACLDADTAGAWIAGELSGPALDDARAHVADCARCQALMAMLAELETEPAATGADEAPAPWWRWLVPVGVVAAMVAAVLLLPRAPTEPAPVVQQEQQSAARQDQDKELEFRPAAPVADAKKNAREQGRVGNRDEKLEGAKPAASAATAAAPPAAPPAPAPAPAPAAANGAVQTKQTAPPPPSSVSGALDKAQVAAGANAAASAPSRALSAQRAASSANELTDALRADVVSPDRTTRWRIAGQAVEKSTDGGATWTVAVTVADASWTAGAAPSSTTLWIVGRQGLVERTTDGRTFTRVAFPATTDLSAVEATSAEIATITTADGRTFSTTDGGNTWVQRLLQETPATPFKD